MSNNKQVLIIDDVKLMSNKLRDAFVDAGKVPDAPFLFTVEQVFKVEDLADRKYGLAKFDVIIIDRWFEDKYKERVVLWYAHSYQVDAVRIVWTAYPEVDNIKECMRLGAWDYLDKNARTSVKSTFDAVVESAVAGLRRKEIAEERPQVFKWVKENEGLRARYAGQLVAVSGEHVVGSGGNVIELFKDIDRRGLDRETVHVFSIPPAVP